MVLDKHSAPIERAFHRVFGIDTTLDFRVGETRGEPVELPFAPPPISESADGNGQFLGSRYRFENFVVGPSNRFAAAAAQAVAEKPGGPDYNPLFIYGGVGLGKTHLLHAVGHYALELYPGMVIRYVSSENFLNEFIDGIKHKRVDGFKQRYRSVDILLLDDVQFFEHKEQILEEFFHTFNSLYELGRQMVITSDRHPRRLSTVQDRLRSRFEWGLLTDIQPPDVETRLAILRRKAEYSSKPVPQPVLEFIAGLVCDNIRELEGALNKVTAYAELIHGQVTLDMAKEVLKDLMPGSATKMVSADDIIAATAAAHGFSQTELRGPSRRQPLVRVRQIAMYLCRDLTDLSLPKIGALFGDRDHTTVMHSIDKINGLMRVDRAVYDTVITLSQSLRKG
jgi:chromosomal replication initiator protein